MKSIKQTMKSFVVSAALVCGVVAVGSAAEYEVLGENIPLRFSYIESKAKGTERGQYINTLYCPSADDIVFCRVYISNEQPTPASPFPTIFGTAWNNEKGRFILQASSRNNASRASYRRDGNETGFTVNIPKEKWVDIVCDRQVSVWTNAAEGTSGRAQTANYGGDPGVPFAVFQGNYASTTGGMKVSDNWWCNMRLNSFNLYSSVKVVRTA